MSRDDKMVNELTVKELKDVIREQVEESNGFILNTIEELKTAFIKLVEENNCIKVEMVKMREEKEQLRKNFASLEDQVKKKNVIFKGLRAEACLSDAIKQVCVGNLKMTPETFSIKSTKKIYENRGQMGVLVELESEEMVEEIFKKARNLAGTNIFLERDLNSERRENKKVMLQLKKDILAEKPNQRISVRNDKLRIADKLIHWDREKQLVCGKEDGSMMINKLVDGPLRAVNFNYSHILSRVNNK